MRKTKPSKVVGVRFYLDDLKVVEDKAYIYKLSTSAYIRRSILSKIHNSKIGEEK